MTLLRWTRPICTPWLHLGAKIRSCALIDWLFSTQRNFPSFFDKNVGCFDFLTVVLFVYSLI